MSAFDPLTLRQQFPILDQQVNGRDLVYLDNAATTQKPRAVIDAIRRYYEHDNANVHRAVHTLAARATQAYEDARDKTRDFINASAREEVIFTSGATESINIVARCWAQAKLQPGDEVLISSLEHHSNIVPWQIACKNTGATLKAIPVDAQGALDLTTLDQLLTPNTRLMAIGFASNAIGTINPVEQLIERAHANGTPVLLDTAQAMAHHRIDVQALGADFLAFSSHKMFGPTGFGILYGKRELLEEMQPWEGGGDMIDTVTLTESTWNELPYRLEAGTPDIAGAVGHAAAIDFVSALDLSAVAKHEQQLLEISSDGLSAIDGLQLVGTADHKMAIVSFVGEQAHPQDIGTLLDENGIAVRTGHHCAMPLMQCFKVPGTVRASFAAYNTQEDAEKLIQATARIMHLFA